MLVLRGNVGNGRAPHHYKGACSKSSFTAQIQALKRMKFQERRTRRAGGEVP
jgi:hypothetical protein